MNFTEATIVLAASTFDGGNADAHAQLFDVWLVNAPSTRLSAVIASEPGRQVRVHRYVERGRIELERHLLDQLVLCCFDRLVREKLLWGWSSSRVQIIGLSRWLYG